MIFVSISIQQNVLLLFNVLFGVMTTIQINWTIFAFYGRDQKVIFVRTTYYVLEWKTFHI